MKKLKSFFLLVLVALIFSFSVAANENTHRASIEKLLVLTEVDQGYEQVFPRIKQFVLQQLKQMNVPQDQSPIIEKYFGKMIDVMKTEMSWDKMKDDYIQLYMSVYTEEEIQGLITFYESPVGQKMIEKMPLLMEQSMVISQKYTQNLLPQIQKIIEEMIAEIQNKAN